jgi:hypothetical protein
VAVGQEWLDGLPAGVENEGLDGGHYSWRASCPEQSERQQPGKARKHALSSAPPNIMSSPPIYGWRMTPVRRGAAARGGGAGRSCWWFDFILVGMVRGFTAHRLSVDGAALAGRDTADTQNSMQNKLIGSENTTG